MGDQTSPLHGRDETMHIPMIFRWPGMSIAGGSVDSIVTNYDFMPSLPSLLDLTMPAQQSSPGVTLQLPGRDFSPALRGEPQPSGRMKSSTGSRTSDRFAHNVGSTWSGQERPPSLNSIIRVATRMSSTTLLARGSIPNCKLIFRSG